MEKKEISNILLNAQKYLYDWIKNKTGYTNGYSVFIEGSLKKEYKHYAGSVTIKDLPTIWGGMTHKEGRDLSRALREELVEQLKPLLDFGLGVRIRSKHIEHGCYRQEFEAYLNIRG